ncbi:MULTISPECIES: restriction endonuclease subunit S [unclassified Staphylococcus]|uniref:restriction endonuclease subunit S n=1 Tax=unclassified Staphylococcus TaxID=91994 RepID=UPI0019520069|nr:MULTISPECIES: restriction endonuclease subunit S [unclassified Staphylococcus]
MTNEMRNVPELRFPEFDGEWEERKIGNYIVEIKKYDTQQHSSYSVATSSRRGLFKQAEYFDGNRVFSDKEVLYSVVPPNTITYRHMSDDNIFKFNINSFNESVLVSREYPVFDVNDYADKNFVFYELNNSSNFLKFCIKQKKGGTRTRLYFKVLENYETFYPEKTEQQKIGEFFSKLDRQIELEEQKLEKLEKQKKGYMQLIFSQQLRFKDENGEKFPDWQTTTLGQLSDITTGSLDANAMVPNGKYKFFTCARETYQIDKYAFDTEALLISGNGANVGYIHYYKGKFNAYQRTYVLDNIQNNINFIKYYLERYLIKRIYSEKRDGNTPYITRSTLYDMSISIPLAKLEQMKISRFLTKLDNKIQNQSDKVELLKERKKGFLQKMFV